MANVYGLQDALTTFLPEVVKLAQAQTGLFTKFFMKKPAIILPTMDISWDELQEYATLAAFYAPDTSVIPNTKGDGVERNVRLAMYKSAHTFTSADLTKRMFGYTQFEDMSADTKMAQYLIESTRKQKEEIANTLEWMCIQAALNSSIPVIGYGENRTIDFYRPAALNKILAGAEIWTNGGSVDIPRQFRTWKLETSNATNGLGVTAVFMNSTTALNLFDTNTVIDALRNRYTQSTIGYTEFDSSTYGADKVTKLGVIEGLSVYTYDFNYDTVSGGVVTSNKGIPDNKIMLISESGATNATAMLAGYPAEVQLKEYAGMKNAGNYRLVRDSRTNISSMLWGQGTTDIVSLSQCTISALNPMIKRPFVMTVQVAP